MPITKRKCRVCGKEYEACRTNKKDIGGFNWREVACSPECGAEYFRLVTEARNPSTKSKHRVQKGKDIKPGRTVQPSVKAEIAKDAGQSVKPLAVNDGDLERLSSAETAGNEAAE